MSIVTIDGKVLSPGVERATVIAGTAACTIGTGVATDVSIFGILVTKALTGTCVITGFRKVTGTTYANQSIILPAATPAGFYPLGGAQNDAGALTVTCANAADDALVVVLWSVN